MKMLRACLLILLSRTLTLCRGECEVSSENILPEKPHAFVDMGTDYNDEPVPHKFKKILSNITLHDDSVSKKYTDQYDNGRLSKAISTLYKELLNRTLNPESEILTTVGGSEALYSSIRGLSSVDDEWIIIEPFYPKFEQHVRLANAIPRFTTLHYVRKSSDRTKLCSDKESAGDWMLNHTEIESLINNKTRGIMFNNPNNPLGKTYNHSELEYITDLVQKHNLLVISDEVYEFTTDSMIRMASLPGMFNRTIAVGSASKTFNLPGWRIGWAYGPKHLIEKIGHVHSEIVSSASLPQQAAVSHFFDTKAMTSGSAHKLFEEKLTSIKRKREFIIKAFENAGMTPIVPQGGYCMLTCWPKIKDGSDLAKLLLEKIYVKGLSAAGYYSENHKNLGIEYVRLCYNKSNKTLNHAAKKLLKLKDLEQYAKQGMPMSDISKLVIEIFHSIDEESNSEQLDDLKSTDSV